MSQENAASFLKKVTDDPALQKQLAGLAPDDMNGLLKIASSQGFGPFTKDEYYVACAAATKPSGQLSEKELDQVAGGLPCTKTYHATPWKSCGFTCGC